MSGLASFQHQVTTTTSRPQPPALHRHEQVHSWANPSYQGPEKLPGRPPHLEVPAAATSCSDCRLKPETFEHPIFSCPSTQQARSRLLHGVTGVGHQDPIWTSFPLINCLANFISVSSTGFPPTMFPPTSPPPPP